MLLKNMKRNLMKTRKELEEKWEDVINGRMGDITKAIILESEERWEDVMNSNTKRNLMNELTEGIEALKEKRKMERDRLDERLGKNRERVNQEELFAPHMDEEQYINRDQLTDYDRIIDKLFSDIQKLKKEVKDLHTELEYYRGFAEHLGAKKAVSQRDKMVQESQEIEQILGKALGYPWYKDDPKNFPNATEADGVCVAPNTAASLAMEAVDLITKLKKRHPTTEEALAQYHWLKANSKRNK